MGPYKWIHTKKYAKRAHMEDRAEKGVHKK